MKMKSEDDETSKDEGRALNIRNIRSLCAWVLPSPLLSCESNHPIAISSSQSFLSYVRPPSSLFRSVSLSATRR
jgi:hypothetical protein